MSSGISNTKCSFKRIISTNGEQNQLNKKCLIMKKIIGKSSLKEDKRARTGKIHIFRGTH